MEPVAEQRAMWLLYAGGYQCSHIGYKTTVGYILFHHREEGLRRWDARQHGALYVAMEKAAVDISGQARRLPVSRCSMV
jgi:hypothetical protein